MKRKLLITLLALVVVFTMSAVPGFAASKKVVQTSSKTYDVQEDGSLELTIQDTTTFNSNGTVKSDKSVYRWLSYEVDEEGNYVDKWVKETYTSSYKYTKGKTKQVIYKTNGEPTSKVVYTYKSNGKVSKITNYNYENGAYKKAGVTTYTYSSKKRTSVTKDAKGNETYKNVNTLDSKGRTTKTVMYQNGKKSGTYTYTYWSNGNTKKSIYKSVDGNEATTWEYNKNGTAKKYSSNWTDDNYSSVESNVYTYNSNGLLTKDVVKSSTTFDGETTKNNYTLTYKYSNYYGSTKKYPKTVWIYKDGKKYQKEERTYKTI